MSIFKTSHSAISAAENPLVSSAALNDELENTGSISDYLKRNKKNMLNCTLPEHLNMLLTQKNLIIADVVRGSQLDRGYVYQIFSGAKMPAREKLIAIAFGLRLSDTETQKMLKLSGYRELYARDERDAVIFYALRENMTLLEANNLLDQYNLKLLGNVEE